MADYTYDASRKDVDTADRSQWWQKGDAPKHESAFSAVRWIERHQAYKLEALRAFISLYGNRRVLGLDPGSYAGDDQKRRRRPRLNICKSATDTVTAKIAKERPRPRPVTDGGDYSLQRAAKQLGKFIDGVFYANKVYDQAPSVFRDGCIAAVGWMHGWGDRDAAEVKVERVFPGEMVWDDAEAYNGMPRTLYRHRYLPREVAAGRWHKKRLDVERAPAAKSGMVAIHRADMIEIVESWHLPSAPGADDGAYIACTPNATLESRKWKRGGFPFAMFFWSDPVMGLAGDGLVEQLAGIHVSLNKHIEAVESLLGLWGKVWVFVSGAANVSKQHLTNELDTIITYDGDKPPTISAPSVVPPDLRQQIALLLEEGYALAGISQMSARAQKPAGLNSGAALREHADIESDRFATTHQAYEQLFLDIAEIVIDEAEELYAGHIDVQARAPGRKFVESVKWGDVSLKRNQYELTMYPTSMLPKTPAGRFAMVQEWIQAGFVSREEGMRLMDMPDLDEAQSLWTAFMDDIDALIESFLHDAPLDGDEVDDLYDPPEAIQFLEWGVNRMKSAYLRGKHEGVPQERLSLLLRWMQEAQALATPPPQPMQPGAPPASPGGPAEMPQPPGPPAQMPPV